MVELTEITEGELKGFIKEVEYRTSIGKLKKDTVTAVLLSCLSIAFAKQSNTNLGFEQA